MSTREDNISADNSGDDKGERIAKYLARAGIASRRGAEKLISEGRISLNGETVRTPATFVKPDDQVALDGESIGPKEETRLWLYHKPKGLVTTHHDPQGRATVFEQLPKGLPRVISIGRLDINTEGLLLLTNDGELAGRLENPATGWKRRYRARAYGTPEESKLKAIREGVSIDGTRYAPADIEIETRTGANLWIGIGLREGKYREARQMLEYAGLKVNRLIRVSFGPFQLGSLKPGEVKEVPHRVLKEQIGEDGIQKPRAPKNKPKPGTRDKKARHAADRRR